MWRLVIPGMILALLSGCVKEERGACPCYLTLNLDAVIERGEYADAVATLSPCIDGGTDRSLLNLCEYGECGYEKKVKKDMVSISVVCGHENAVFSEDCIRISDNTQADPIMAYAENVLCESEKQTAYVQLHKQYCHIRFIQDGTDSGSKVHYGSRVVAGCNGMRLYDLSPVEGIFMAEAVSGEGGVQSLMIPRQKRSELSLDILNADGEVIDVVDLGAAFSKAGYDWGKEDLDDISIRIDYAKSEFEIMVIPWKTNYESIDM